MFLCFRFVFRRALLLRYVSFFLDGLILSTFLKSLLLIHDHPHVEQFLYQRESFRVSAWNWIWVCSAEMREDRVFYLV
jgi:hypothetical protein